MKIDNLRYKNTDYWRTPSSGVLGFEEIFHDLNVYENPSAYLDF